MSSLNTYPKVYSIVVTYNGVKWISKCIYSLLNSTQKNHIIVIDNNSSDKTVEIIDNSFPTVEIIKSKINLGFGRANNIGFRKAIENDADYVFLLNQDAWTQKSTLYNLINISKKNPDYGLLSPTHLDGSGNKIDYKFCSYVSPPATYNYINDLHLGRLNSIYEVPFINAACWLVPVQTLIKVGGFDPLFFHYGEDMDYCNRILKKNLKVGFCPMENIYHLRENPQLEQKTDQTKILFAFEEAKIINKLKNENEKKGYFHIILSLLKKNTKNIFFARFKNISLDFYLLKKTVLNKKTIIKNLKNEKIDYPWYLEF